MPDLGRRLLRGWLYSHRYPYCKRLTGPSKIFSSHSEVKVVVVKDVTTGAGDQEKRNCGPTAYMYLILTMLFSDSSFRTMRD